MRTTTWMALLMVSVLGAAGAAMAMDLAKVNDHAITDKDLLSALANLNEGQRSSVLKDTNARRQVLGNIIEQEILLQEAQKENLDKDDDFKNAMDVFRKKYLTNRLLQKAVAARVNDKAVEKYYDSHKNRYSTDQVHAMHILVADETKARDLMKELKATDDPQNDKFQEYAEKLSKDPSAKNNRGDLGFFGRDRMVPEFTEAAFRGNDGELVGPVKTAYGYHIIKVIQKKLGKVLEFNDVKARARTDMRNDLVEDYVNKLRAETKVTVEDKNLEKM